MDEVLEGKLEKALGKEGPGVIRQLISRGLVQRIWKLPRPKASHRYDCYVRLPLVETDPEAVSGLDGNQAPRQRALYEALNERSEPIPLALATKEYGSSAVQALHRKGLVAMEWVRVDRGPLIGPSGDGASAKPPVPNPGAGPRPG